MLRFTLCWNSTFNWSFHCPTLAFSLFWRQTTHTDLSTSGSVRRFSQLKPLNQSLSKLLNLPEQIFKNGPLQMVLQNESLESGTLPGSLVILGHQIGDLHTHDSRNSRKWHITKSHHQNSKWTHSNWTQVYIARTLYRLIDRVNGGWQHGVGCGD